MGVLGKYLAALAASYQPANEQQQQQQIHAPNSGSSKAYTTSSKRKRLHILYLLNDILHHTKYHGQNPSAFSTLSGALQPYLVELFDHAAGYGRRKNPKHFARLDELLDIWASSAYYSADYVDKLRQTVDHAASPDAINAKASMKDTTTTAAAAEPDRRTVAKDPPFVMPATHGDPNALWHELPAGNLMPLVVPNSSAPIRPQSVKPLQFVAGPADETLVKAVKHLLKDTDRIYNASGGVLDGETLVDVDELGQLVVRDETTGEVNEGDGYYGWSRPFCQKMKERREGKVASRSPSHSRSRSRSSSPRKRRRYSNGASEDEDRRVRSKPRGSPPVGTSRRGHSMSRSRSPSRSPAAKHSPSRSRSYSPRPPLLPQTTQRPQQQQQQPPAYAAPPPPPAMPYQYPTSSTQSQFSPPPQPGGSPDSFHAPPPRPPNYNGPWPPPPPPLPQQQPSPSPSFPHNPNMNMNMNMDMNMNMNTPGYGSQFPHPNASQNFMQPPVAPQQLSHAHGPPGPFPYSAPHHAHGSPQPYARGGRGGGRGDWNRGGWS